MFGLAFVIAACGAPPAPPAYRTDGGDPKLPWYRPQAGVFPPGDAAAEDAGRLVRADGPNRSGRYVCDSVHSIEYLDHFTDFELLPYGRVWRFGAPAELREVPPGTHLHLRGYPDGPPGGAYSGNKFTRLKVLTAEDDFSLRVRRAELLRVERFDAGGGRLFVTARRGGRPVGDPARPTELSVGPDTRVWKGKEVGGLADVAAGQDVLVNLTGAVPFQSSGLRAHVTDVWVDAAARELATRLQAERHRAWVRQRGLPAWVDRTEGKRVTLTLFAEVNEFPADGPRQALAEGRPVHLMPATDALRIWANSIPEPGTVRGVAEIPRQPGSAGLQVVVEPRLLIEGFRPGRVVRVFPANWPAAGLPVEEAFHPLMSP